ncbi:MAG: dTMP kinase [Deltaproteobacteria bacterium]|nr:dTMP kinase [Deltaproteobacteria bacterium]
MPNEPEDHLAAEKALGYFFAFEGLDGSGKTTQAKLLAQFLESKFNQKPLLLREPTTGPVGQIIRQKLFTAHKPVNPQTELELFLADRAWDVDTNILPALGSGRHVIIDRYILSNAAYQGFLGAQDPQAIISANAHFPQPNLTIILEISPQAAFARIKARGPLIHRYEDPEYLKKVKEIYDSFSGPNLLRLKAESDLAVIHEQITQALKNLNLKGLS